MLKKTVVGLIERVSIDRREYLARVDTGAERSSICKSVVEKMANGKKIPIIKRVSLRTSTGTQERPVIKVSIKVRDRRLLATFNVTDRHNMTYKVLIGQNILKKDFLIDPQVK